VVHVCQASAEIVQYNTVHLCMQVRVLLSYVRVLLSHIGAGRAIHSRNLSAKQRNKPFLRNYLCLLKTMVHPLHFASLFGTLRIGSPQLQ